MKKILTLIICLGLFLTAVPAGAEQIDGDMGEYIVYCNVEGAEVFLNDEYKGLISCGELRVPIYTTGTPYNTIVVKQITYIPYTEQILEHPAAGQTVKINAPLEREFLSSPLGLVVLMIIGGLLGWFGTGLLNRNKE